MAEFVSGLDLHLSRNALEALRLARSPDSDIPHHVATSWITEEIMRQGLWPGFDCQRGVVVD